MKTQLQNEIENNSRLEFNSNLFLIRRKNNFEFGFYETLGNFEF